MRCVDCKYCSYIVYGQYFCDIHKRSKRISDNDAHKDVPCYKYERKEKKND